MRKSKEKALGESVARELEVRPLAQVNEYYIDIANKFKTTKYAVLIFLVVFVLCMISIFRSDITLENCKYLIRFFSTAVSHTGEYEPIYYDTSGVVDVELFNGNLVTIKNDGVDFYDMKGNNTESHDISQVSPTVVSVGKHMIVYDLGGKGFELFNNFSKLAGETYEYPISNAAISNEGMYAVVTKSLDYQSIVYLYDHNYNLITKISKDKYITDIKINSQGNKVLIISAYTDNGVYKSEIMSYVPYTDKVQSNYELDGEFAVMCGFHSNGSYTVLTDSALLFFDKNDELVSKFKLGTIVPNNCLILDDGVVLDYNRNIVGSECELKVFDTDGSERFTSVIEDKILDTAAYTEDLYLLLDSKVSRVDWETGEITTCNIDSGATGIYIYDKEQVVIGYSNMARAYGTAELFDSVIKEEKS